MSSPEPHTAPEPHTEPESVAAPSIAAWDEPAGLAARGTVIVVVGRGEHPGLYERFGRRISADAWKVRAVADPITQESIAAQQIAGLLSDPDLPEPKVLVGSDSGAAYVAARLAAGDLAPSGAVLVGLPTTPRAAASRDELRDWDAELLERTSCSAHRARLTSDTGMRRGAIGDESVPQGWLDAIVPSALGVPVLALHGADDRISPLDGVRALLAAAPHARLVSIVGGKHDALNDKTHRVAAATTMLFLESLKVGPDVPEIAHTERLGEVAR
jgi:pimeloyl-ACP methyl ester carboxylesterase